MKFLSNVLQTLSTLGLHAEKKKTNSERYLQIFYSLVSLQPEEKAELKYPTYRSNEFQFFQQGVCELIFPSKFNGGGGGGGQRVAPGRYLLSHTYTSKPDRKRIKIQIKKNEKK